jgi:4'-phosphopantetheinyl transferase
MHLTTTQPTVLENNSLHIWLFSLHAWLSHSQQFLEAEEQQRAERFYFERHQRRFSTARTRVREILGLYLDQQPETLVFTYGKQGKPAVINDRNLHFNVSHTGDSGILAISSSPIGVDMEQYSGRPYSGIARQLFSEQEQQFLAALPPLAQPAFFFRIWALKEAFIKANGLGLSYPLQAITMPLQGTEPVLLEDHLHEKTWKILHFMPSIAFSAAFCCDPAINTFSLQTWV